MSYCLIGKTTHKRYKTSPHRFTYPLYMLQVPLSDLPSLTQYSWLIGYNQRRLLSIYDTDYLTNEPRSIAHKLDQLDIPFIKQATRCDLILMPRLIIRTFKPISLYLYYQDSDLSGLIAEVHNTYNEAHYYAIDTKQTQIKPFKINKAFHVSPFFDESGDYNFSVVNTDQTFELHIGYKQTNKPVFYANFCAKKQPLTSYRIILLALRYPLTLALVYPRILWQAGLLFYAKKLQARPKPPQSKSGSLRSMPTDWLARLILKRLNQLNHTDLTGGLILQLPDGHTLTLGQHDTDAGLIITNTWFFRSIAFGGEIGLGESFMKGEWTSNDPVAVITFIVRNLDCIRYKFNGLLITRVINRIKHAVNANTVSNSRHNIGQHYDLGNAFYSLFLDKTMMYSSGLFMNPDDTLAQAQAQKVNRLCDALALKPGDTVLEIGSGWGYVALTLATVYGCHVKTITLSQEQYDYTKQRVSSVADHVSVALQDYRTVTGQFDAIISIEMIEAVGHDYLSVFFETCNRLLKPGGRMALQSIIYQQDDLYNRYRKNSDFIRKHIFPGGHLPARRALDQMIKQHTQFSLCDSMNIASSYAKTLNLWRQAVISQKDQIMALGFDDLFYRKWVYYLAYCEAGFATDYLGCYHFIYEKITNQTTRLTKH